MIISCNYINAILLYYLTDALIQSDLQKCFVEPIDKTYTHAGIRIA